MVRQEHPGSQAAAPLVREAWIDRHLLLVADLQVSMLLPMLTKLRAAEVRARRAGSPPRNEAGGTA